jgi:hypothetical protein
MGDLFQRRTALLAEIAALAMRVNVCSRLMVGAILLSNLAYWLAAFLPRDMLDPQTFPNILPPF